MASITVTLTAPDAAVPAIRRTLGWRLNKADPVTAAELKADIESYLKLCVKADVRQQKEQAALAAAMVDDSDGTLSW